MDIIHSHITKDRVLWLYNIKLPWINRYFEKIIIWINWTQKKYWKADKKFEKINLNDTFIWYSIFDTYYILCFINLKNLKSQYFFVKSFDVFDIKLDLINNNFFIFKDFNDNIWFYTNYEWNDYCFEIKNKDFIVKNNIFDSEIFRKDINFSNWNTKELNFCTWNVYNYLNIADFIIYDDFFIKWDESNFDVFFDFIKKYNWKNIKVNNNINIKLKITKYDTLYYPKININLKVFIKNINNFDLTDIRKLILSFFNENIVCNLINKKHIQDYFWKYLNDFTNVNLENIEPHFTIPKNIYESNDIFEKFKIDLLKLRYNLFLLKENYNSKINIKNQDNEHIKLANTKLNINKEILRKIIKNYEKVFWEFLKKI